MIALVDIHEAIADTLAAQCGAGLSVYHYVPEQMSSPAAIVTLAETDIAAFKLGVYELAMRITVCTSTGADRAGQEQLMSFVDFGAPTSVWRALYDNPTLGLTGVSCAPQKYTPLGKVTIGGYDYYAGAFDLLVVTSPGAS